MNLNELKDKAGVVSDAIFGRERGPLGPVKKLRDEVNELIECFENGEDPGEEFADCFLILLDAYRKHYGDDVDIQKLIDDSSAKLDVVLDRKYVETEVEGVFQHIKEEEDDGDPWDMSVHSAGGGHYLSEAIPHDQLRTWDGLNMDKIQDVYDEILEEVVFELISAELINKVKKLMIEKLPNYNIQCDDHNNTLETISEGHIWVRITDPITSSYVDVVF